MSLFPQRRRGLSLGKRRKAARTIRSRGGFTSALSVERLEDRRMLAAGDLDLTFGVGGKVLDDWGLVFGTFSGGEEMQAMTTQADGKILTAGLVQITNTGKRDVALARYNVDGTRDLSFGGGDGFVLFNASLTTGGDDGVGDVSLDDQGRIIIVGSAANNTPHGPFNVNGQGVFVGRLSADGVLDPTFDGDGIAFTSITTQFGRDVIGPIGTLRFAAMGIQDDGKVVVGTSITGVFGEPFDFLVLRYDATGALDTTFNGVGYNITDFSAREDRLTSLAIQSDGKIVAGGFSVTDPATQSDFALARYNADGTLDESFGVDGKVITNIVPASVLPGVLVSQDFLNSVTVQADGMIVAGGFSRIRPQAGLNFNDLIIARYTSAGALDTTFAPGSQSVAGTLRVDVSGNFNNEADESMGLIVQPDGKYVIGGQYSKFISPFNIDARAGAALARVLPTGELDASFGVNGKMTAAHDNDISTQHRMTDVMLGPDGKILVLSVEGDNPEFNVSMMRFESGLLVADIGGVFTLNEPGGAVQLTGTGIGVGALSYAWDLDDDGVFGEASTAFGDETLQDPLFSVSADGPASFTVRLEVTSVDVNNLVQTAIDTQIINVVNVAPAVAADQTIVTVNEGSTATNTGAWSDIPADVVTLSASIGAIVKNADGTWSWSYSAADGPATQTVTVTASDEDGGSSSAAFQLTVNNVAPLVQADAATVVANEGGSVAMTGVYSDVPGDTVTLTASVGTIVDEGNGVWSWSHVVGDGPATLPVTITANDGETGGMSTALFNVEINNVAPALAVAQASVAVDEGTLAANGGSVSDVLGDVVTLTASAGTVVDNGDGTWSWSHLADDGPAAQSVTITANDNEGGISTVTFALTVDNVAPTLTVASALVSANEGTVALNGGLVGDVPLDTVALTASIGAVANNGDGTWSWSYVAADGPAAQTVTITANDGDGGITAATFQLDVANVAPAITVAAPSVTVDEGTIAAINGAWSDVAADVVTLTASLGTVTKNSGGTWSWSYAAADGPATQTVTITATDDDLGAASVTFDLIVNNVAPTADAGADALTFDDTPITLTGSGVDPAGGLDPLAFEWDLDNDGDFDATGASVVFDPVALGFSGTQTRTVTLRVTDGDGGVATDAVQVSLLGEGTLLVDGVLHVVGNNSANDLVLITQFGDDIYVYATFNDDNPAVFAAAAVSEIQVRTRGGHDVVVTTSNVLETMTIDGGADNDLIIGGGGGNLLLGGAGHDTLYGSYGDDVLLGGDGDDDLLGFGGYDVLVGGSGRDILNGGDGRDLLIGGIDEDLLHGGASDDILIGGYTSHDDDLTALDAIMAIWGSSQTFDDRVSTLTSPGGLLVAGVTVFDDASQDHIIGAAGRDLAFADTSKNWDGVKDTASLSPSQDTLIALN